MWYGLEPDKMRDNKKQWYAYFFHCLFVDQYFIWLEKRRINFILNYLIDTIKSVHFAIIDLKTKIKYNIVKYPIIGLIKGS